MHRSITGTRYTRVIYFVHGNTFPEFPENNTVILRTILPGLTRMRVIPTRLK